MSSYHEMPIPKSGSQVVVAFVFTTIGINFTLLGMVNLISGEALIASTIWLAFVTVIVWTGSQAEGGVWRFLISLVGELFGKRFAEWNPAEEQPRGIRFGFQLGSHRFVERYIFVDGIQLVEWCTGQATDRMGRDMNDWCIFVWFSRDLPARPLETKKLYRNPHQGLIAVGPSASKVRTEALGQSLVSFIPSAGADLVQGDSSTCFVRASSEKGMTN